MRASGPPLIGFPATLEIIHIGYYFTLQQLLTKRLQKLRLKTWLEVSLDTSNIIKCCIKIWRIYNGSNHLR